MAYDASIDERIRAYTATWGIEMKNMFGGICYLSAGNMMCGLNNDGLMIRLGVEAAGEIAASVGGEQAAPAGRPMKGWLTVPLDRIGSDDALHLLLERAREFVSKLPPKRN